MKLLIGIFLLGIFAAVADPQCRRGCDLALVSYNLQEGLWNLSFISRTTQLQMRTILFYNPQIPNEDAVQANMPVNVPIRCDCLDTGVLGHLFSYTSSPGDTYDLISGYYSGLTTVDWLQRSNPYPSSNIPGGVTLHVPVNCSCGDRRVSSDYGLFVTYPLREGETLEEVAAANNLTADVVRRYNPTANFSSGSGVVFIPGRDLYGSFRPLSSSTSGLPSGAIAGISIGTIVGVLLIAGCLYLGYRRKKNAKKNQLLSASEYQLQQAAPGGKTVKAPDPVLTGITVDKSVEFSYEELANATDDFSIANKIGEGGFGAVYYAELRGEKAAIKKMDMQASKEFLAELKVLTNVHHLNLVRLIGYCVEGSLFLVYEFIENGNLSQHLRGSGRESLPWPKRVQIALDSAQGLEYIHEHTVHVYIHRDIKPANILIDKNFHAKVADFGLTKLTEVGNSSLPTARLAGTFGHMSPEYVQFGDVSRKIDVYAFGVVLYELISAKEAIIKSNSSSAYARGLVGLVSSFSAFFEVVKCKVEFTPSFRLSLSWTKKRLELEIVLCIYVQNFDTKLGQQASLSSLIAPFEEALSMADSSEDLKKLIDPKLGENYSLDSVEKMVQLAKACTHENPQLRPSMRSVVVALMALSSSTKDWDVNSFYGNQGFPNLMTGSRPGIGWKIPNPSPNSNNIRIF